ncbi:replication protein [Acinetobacter gerneri]|uniref:Replication protein n=1 Tax=Acinetobacter gerneri TaxID=202952 RepID=A0AAW8JFU9_9GAMM|nr:replication protein [Acinetobacter gerneri]MDQ9009011.1 replication protein [Acinetobacter gerneri]MDQ9013115.1 replication protein [Acinetobacter gerneri]MDQ9024552.1 replication protein [Acinetobacter gerneri]MDQ9051787.1 replication protein [Acinetobacter gerneri]MDQ9059233.1 replication protein [Acinetobacter gerneri]
MSKFVPNSFQVPNAFVDEVLNKISDAACKLYLVICRKTRGWNKEMDSISLTQFEEVTGKTRPTVIKCLRELIKVGLVVELKSTFHGNTYKLGDETSIGVVVNFPSKNILLDENKADASKNSLPLLVKNFNYTSKNILPLLVKNFYTQSITIKNNSTKNKKINKKSSSVSEKPKTENQNSFDAKSVELPNQVNRDLWNNFVDMRTGNKKPLTENAVKLILKKLESYGALANQSLENSIIGNYQGVFPPKQQYQQNPQSLNNHRNVNDAWANQPVFTGYVEQIDVPEDFV